MHVHTLYHGKSLYPAVQHMQVKKCDLYAEDGSDYDSSGFPSFFIQAGATPAGDSPGLFIPVDIPIINDMSFEKDHDFNVTITETEDRVTISVPSSTTTVTITDDEST